MGPLGPPLLSIVPTDRPGSTAPSSPLRPSFPPCCICTVPGAASPPPVARAPVFPARALLCWPADLLVSLLSTLQPAGPVLLVLPLAVLEPAGLPLRPRPPAGPAAHQVPGLCAVGAAAAHRVRRVMPCLCLPCWRPALLATWSVGAGKLVVVTPPLTHCLLPRQPFGRAGTPPLPATATAWAGTPLCSCGRSARSAPSDSRWVDYHTSFRWRCARACIAVARHGRGADPCEPASTSSSSTTSSSRSGRCTLPQEKVEPVPRRQHTCMLPCLPSQRHCTFLGSCWLRGLET